MKVLVLGKGVANDGVILLLDEEKIEYDYLDINEITHYEYEYVIKAPGIPYTEEHIQKFLDLKIRVITDIELAYILRKKMYIGVTGSNGKTTTVSLIKHILSAKYHVVACGNIGYSLCRALVEQKNADIFILELSSFQLENSKIDLDISVLLNVHPCHLDHHKDFKDYALSKANIFLNQSSLHKFIYNADDPVIRSMINTQAQQIPFSKASCLQSCYIHDGFIYYNHKKIFKIDKKWNKPYLIEDIMASICASLPFAKITPRVIQKQLESFEEIEFRLTKINDYIYNDAKSTNPYSTMAALECFSKVRLICGGYDRKEDLSCLNDSLSKINCCYSYGNSKEKIKKYMEAHQVECFLFDTVDEALLKAFSDRKDEIILYSPMFASFDHFKNYIERGQYFNKIALNLLKQV